MGALSETAEVLQAEQRAWQTP